MHFLRLPRKVREFVLDLVKSILECVDSIEVGQGQPHPTPPRRTSPRIPVASCFCICVIGIQLSSQSMNLFAPARLKKYHRHLVLLELSSNGIGHHPCGYAQGPTGGNLTCLCRSERLWLLTINAKIASVISRQVTRN